MTAAALVVLAAGALVAFANGANDVSKGIATLAGCGVTDTRRAIRWGALCTGLGGLAGAALAGAMLSTFGHGLLVPGTAPTFPAALATILGASAWIVLATRTGLPVSTTHALLGAIAGVGIAAYGAGALNWGSIGGKIALPLLASPLASLASTHALTRLLRGRADCLCAGVEPAAIASAAQAGPAIQAGARLHLAVAPVQECPAGRGVSVRLTLDHLHWLTSGGASAARGMNDAPKIAALVLAAAALSGGGSMDPGLVFTAITAGMVGGSVVAGRRVTRILAEKITPMDHREGFTANLVTALLVAAGAVGGLPMSTTHVSAGAILGMGTGRSARSIQWGTVRDMALAWIVTLPAAALLGVLAWEALS